MNDLSVAFAETLSDKVLWAQYNKEASDPVYVTMPRLLYIAWLCKICQWCKIQWLADITTNLVIEDAFHDAKEWVNII